MCEHCDGNEKDMRIQPLSDVKPESAFVCPDGAPAICVIVNGEWVYLDINCCPMCGRDLRGDAS